MTWREALAKLVRGELLRDAPLAPKTSIGVGGPADALVRPADPGDLAAVLAFCAREDVPVTALGGGNNLLVSNAGVRGVALKLPPHFGGPPSFARGELALSAGEPSSALVQQALEHGRVGMEFIAGVPGTVGGNVAMNAGTKNGEMSNIVARVEIATASGAGWLAAKELGFAYRTCRLPPGGVVTRVAVALPEGDVAQSRRAIKDDLDYRKRTQPLGQPTFGSTFRNPPGDHAGRLIEAVGLKGHREGGAMWSDVHANFVVNLGQAKAHDVLALMKLARKRVREHFGIELEPEVRLIGEFSDEERDL